MAELTWCNSRYRRVFSDLVLLPSIKNTLVGFFALGIIFFVDCGRHSRVSAGEVVTGCKSHRSSGITAASKPPEVSQKSVSKLGAEKSNRRVIRILKRAQTMLATERRTNYTAAGSRFQFFNAPARAARRRQRDVTSEWAGLTRSRLLFRRDRVVYSKFLPETPPVVLERLLLFS